MNELPVEARRLVEAVVAEAELGGVEAEELRRDLEQHFIDGLASGRSIEELVDRFGDPRTAAELVSRGGARPRPTAGRRVLASREGWATGLARDLRLAARSLGRAPGLVATVTLVLALGIAATVVAFTVLNELLLRPLPVHEPATLVDVWADIPGGNSFLGVSYHDYLAYREGSRTLEELAAFTGRRIALGPAGQEIGVVGQLVSPPYFRMLGLRPAVGRLDFPEGGSFGDPLEAVLSHGLWVGSFGADPTVVGRTLLLDGVTATVVGVAPPGFRGHFIGFPSDLWLPITSASSFVPGFDPDDAGQKPFEMIGRRRDGAGVEAVRAELNAIAAALEALQPEVNRGHRVGVTATTGLDHSLHTAVTTFVAILTAIAVLVLVVACLNAGGMLLVRTMSRDRELSVRVALGAGHARIVRALLAESMLLVGLGSGVGVLAGARLGQEAGALLSRLAPGLGLELPVDERVLGLTGLTALLAAILSGLAPVLHVLGKDPAGALRGRGGAGRVGGRLRSALVVGQMTASVVLVVVTGLFVRALGVEARVDPGFAADEVATLTLSLASLPSPEDRRLALERALGAVAGLAEVQDVSVADAPPIGVARSPVAIEVPGVAPPPGQEVNVVDARRVGAGYLRTIGVPLRAGRDFDEVDAGEAPPVAIVSEAFVRAFRPGAEVVGWSLDVDGEPVRVVGVAADARYLVQQAEPEPFIYLSTAGRFGTTQVMTVRAASPTEASQAITDAVWAAIPEHRRAELRVARVQLDDALLPQRIGSVLIGSMGLAALLLATVGLYGLVHFTVARDTHEMGVRLALGGGRSDLVALVFRRGFGLVGLGLMAGLAIALAVAPSLGVFLGSVSPTDPLVYGVVIVCFSAVGLLASWAPARRALRIDASAAMRGGE